MLKTGVTQNFLNLFSHELVDQSIVGANKLNLFVLRISNNRFNYDALVQQLYDLIITFSLSRTELDRLKDTPGGQKYKLACEKLRNHFSNEGELGEILLYCFLESHLAAPKLLTKLELKTAPNNYVNGADGVHLYKIKENNFQLVFGESKLNSNLKTGIDEAFKSIKAFLDSSKNKLSYETHLLTSQLLKESVDNETYEFLKKILIPTERSQDTELDNSFGVFLGFEFVVPTDKSQLENEAFRAFIKNEVTKIIQETTSKIIEKLNETHLTGYSFYFYIMPFTDLEFMRKEIIKKITV